MCFLKHDGSTLENSVTFKNLKALCRQNMAVRFLHSKIKLKYLQKLNTRKDNLAHIRQLILKYWFLNIMFEDM